MISACQNGKYITRNTTHFKLIDPAIKQMKYEEEQEEDDESTNGEHGTYICWKSLVLTRDLRLSECGRKPFKHLVKPFMNNDYTDL